MLQSCQFLLENIVANQWMSKKLQGENSSQCLRMSDENRERCLARSAPLARAPTASKNPNAGLKSYFGELKETRRHASAPLENKVFTNYCSVIDHDVLKNKGLHKTLNSLEPNYTRGVSQSNEKNQRGAKKESPSKESDKARPCSPTPGGWKTSSSLGADYSSREILIRNTREADPNEWTKQRMHENNMEWRSGYEVSLVIREKEQGNGVEQNVMTKTEKPTQFGHLM